MCIWRLSVALLSLDTRSFRYKICSAAAGVCHLIRDVSEQVPRLLCRAGLTFGGTRIDGFFMDNESDTLMLLDSVPMPAPVSTEPFTIADEGRAMLVYRIAPSCFHGYGPFVRNEEPFCLVRFDGAVFQSLGPPNDEELSQHVLYAKGLRCYGAYEVVNSSLVGEWWPNAPRVIALRHFIFTFEDSSFECVANDCRLDDIYG